MNTRQLFSAGLEVVLHKLQLQHSWAVSREANWTHPLWNTSNLIPLERMARRKPRWLRLMFSLNSWLYSAVKSGQGTGWESKVQGSMPSTCSELFYLSVAHSNPPQEGLSARPRVCPCATVHVTLPLQGQTPNCRKTKPL